MQQSAFFAGKIHSHASRSETPGFGTQLVFKVKIQVLSWCHEKRFPFTQLEKPFSGWAEQLHFEQKHIGKIYDIACANSTRNTTTSFRIFMTRCNYKHKGFMDFLAKHAWKLWQEKRNCKGNIVIIKYHGRLNQKQRLCQYYEKSKLCILSVSQKEEKSVNKSMRNQNYASDLITLNSC